MYAIKAEAVIEGELPDVWAAAVDVARWPEWDPHEEAARLDGAFAAGGTGWSKPRGGPATAWTITEISVTAEERRWASECPLPGGKLSGANFFAAAGEGRVRCAKTVWVSGPLVPLFRLYFGRRIRRDMLRTWAALETEAAARAGA